MESLTEMLHHYGPPSFIYQSLRIWAPIPHIPGPLRWKGAPMERDAHIPRLS
jgi:hypothetical protein